MSIRRFKKDVIQKYFNFLVPILSKCFSYGIIFALYAVYPNKEAYPEGYNFGIGFASHETRLEYLIG